MLLQDKVELVAMGDLQEVTQEVMEEKAVLDAVLVFLEQEIAVDHLLQMVNLD
jgi:hypothetical protein